LLEPSDEAFVTHAYHMLLRREPDATGGSHYLERLRTGRSTKIQVLGQLRYSREGRQAGVTVPGLWLPFVLQTVYRLPVIGGILALAALILRPRDLIARLRRLEAREERFRTEIAAQRARQQGLAEELTQVKWLADTKANGVEWLELRRRVEDGPATAREQAFQERVEQALNRMREQLFDQQQAFQERVEQALNRMREQLFDQRRHLVDQQRRLGLLLEEARKRLPAPLDEQQLATFADEHDHRLDALYVSFEDCFRGTRTEIEQRLRVYLPHLRQAGVGVDDRPILDLGCGRGEWLELLAQEGFIARGIDLNRVMVAECRDRGLRVEQAEALACLRALPDASLGAVTGLHVIEHLSLATLVDLLDEALRVVRPGGLAIFETPNPENLRVGAYNFYFDPTHRNPLPPSLSAFLLEGRGWTPVEILRLNPYPEHQRFSVDGGQSQVTSWLNEVFCGPQDYAVLGHKP
jgi:O-antigen chain-terminating methyltransferase